MTCEARKRAAAVLPTAPRFLEEIPVPLPDHLQPIEPAAAVHELIDRIGKEVPASSYGVTAEALAFLETRTPHDGRRLANALRHVLKRPDLASEVEALLG